MGTYSQNSATQRRIDALVVIGRMDLKLGAIKSGLASQEALLNVARREDVEKAIRAAAANELRRKGAPASILRTLEKEIGMPRAASQKDETASHKAEKSWVRPVAALAGVGSLLAGIATFVVGGAYGIYGIIPVVAGIVTIVKATTTDPPKKVVVWTSQEEHAWKVFKQEMGILAGIIALIGAVGYGIWYGVQELAAQGELNDLLMPAIVVGFILLLAAGGGSSGGGGGSSVSRGGLGGSFRHQYNSDTGHFDKVPNYGGE